MRFIYHRYLCSILPKKVNPMKRGIIVCMVLIVVGVTAARTTESLLPVYQQQDEELIPSEDSVSIDDMDPIFYDAAEDETMADESGGGNTKLIIGIVGVVILVGVGFLLVNRSQSGKEE